MNNTDMTADHSGGRPNWHLAQRIFDNAKVGVSFGDVDDAAEMITEAIQTATAELQADNAALLELMMRIRKQILDSTIHTPIAETDIAYYSNKAVNTPRPGKVLLDRLVDLQRENGRLKVEIHDGDVLTTSMNEAIERLKAQLSERNAQLLALLDGLAFYAERGHIEGEPGENDPNFEFMGIDSSTGYPVHVESGMKAKQTLTNTHQAAEDAKKRIREEAVKECIERERQRLAPALDLAAAAYAFDTTSRNRTTGAAKNSQIPPLRRHLTDMVMACPIDLLTHPSLQALIQEGGE